MSRLCTPRGKKKRITPNPDAAVRLVPLPHKYIEISFNPPFENHAMQTRYVVTILMVVAVAASTAADHGGGKMGGGGKPPAKPENPPTPSPLPHDETGPGQPHDIDDSLSKSKTQAAQDSLAQLLGNGNSPNIVPRLPGAGPREPCNTPSCTSIPPSGGNGSPPSGRPRPHGADAE